MHVHVVVVNSDSGLIKVPGKYILPDPARTSPGTSIIPEPQFTNTEYRVSLARQASNQKGEWADLRGDKPKTASVVSIDVRPSGAHGATRKPR